MELLHYLYEEKNGEYKIHSTPVSNYYSVEAHLKGQGFIPHGCFGRIEYAEIWCDFYNKNISHTQLRRFLDKC